MREINKANFSSTDVNKKLYALVTIEDNITAIYKFKVLFNPETEKYKAVFFPITSVYAIDNISTIEDFDNDGIVRYIIKMFSEIIAEIETNETVAKSLMEFNNDEEFFTFINKHSNDTIRKPSSLIIV